MRNLPRILLATALSTLAFSTLTAPTWAADDTDTVKTTHPPYKPGRELDADATADTRSSAVTRDAPIPDDGSEPVKRRTPPYKPGRQANDSKDDSGSAND